ncbi:MAG TPA: SDR family NAD(P)-dependent oxidoreductase [Vicinamibacterales bacterium]|nr:SDR family NAD(P)-dependent oxidoreductase [Vicinamibacterales bacterium]
MSSARGPSIVSITGASSGIGRATAELVAREGAAVVVSARREARLTALEAFRRQGHGHLVVVSSYAGRRGIGGSSVYGATKAAAINLVESLRAEFVGTRLRASVILPVTVETEFRPTFTREFGHVIAPARADRFIQKFTRRVRRVDPADGSTGS